MKRPKKRCQLSKRQVYYWLHRIYQLLKSDKADVLFKKLVGEDGECTKYDEKKNRKTYFEIKINPRGSDFFKTVIHECIHAIAWNLPHRKVYWLQNQLVREMSICQFVHLLEVFTKAVKRHYKERRR